MKLLIIFLFIPILYQGVSTGIPSDVFLEFVSSVQIACPALADPDIPTSGACSNARVSQSNENRSEKTANKTEPPHATPASSFEADKRNDAVPTEAPKQPIATFDEWTKEKLRQEQRRTEQKANSPPVGGPSVLPHNHAQNAAATRNYASRECGAKIMASNTEAENTKALLNDKEKDEYMRNPCEAAPQKFVIIELCETIQPHTIELGNFELFSSGPRGIRVSAAERFPATEWTPILDVEAQEARTLQSFRVNKFGMYAKFLKVELLSHYGKEHYCTLTMLRVLGMSIVEEYEAEAEIAAGRIVHVHSNNPSSTPESVIEPAESQNAHPTTPEQSVAKEAIPPTVKAEIKEPVKLEKNSENATLKRMPSIKDPSNESQSTAGRILKKLVNVVIEKFVPEKRKKVSLNYFDVCTKCLINNTASATTRHFCRLVGLHPKFDVHVHTQEVVSRANRLRLFRLRRAFLQRTVALPRLSPNVETIRSQVAPEEAKEKVESTTPSGTTSIEDPPNVKAPEATPPPKIVEVEVEPTPAPQQSTTIVDPLPASSTSHKESVFLKLNKRIAALELNMSLSSEYLSELSRQYVAQAEQQESNIARAKRVAEEAVFNATIHLNSTLSEQLESMRHEVEQLAAFLGRMRKESANLQLRLAHRAHDGYSETAQCEHDDETMEDENAVGNYLASTDGLWTTEQVVYVVVVVQIVTALVVSAIHYCFRQKPLPPAPSLTTADVERIVEHKLKELQSISASSKPEPVTSSVNKEDSGLLSTSSKRRRRRKRKICGESDSAVDSSLPTPSVTHSDGDSDSDNRRRESLGANDVQMSPDHFQAAAGSLVKVSASN